MKRTSFIILGMMLFNSCAINQKIDYRGFGVNAKEIKINSLDLAFLDHRDAVANGKKDPTFVGYMRSAAGIAYTLKTKSNQNFMDELANGMVESLKLLNIQATKIQTKWDETEDAVRNKLFASGGNKKLFFVIHELHTDGYTKEALFYDIDIYIYNRSGSLLRNKLFKGDTKLEGPEVWDPAGRGINDYKIWLPRLVSKFFEHIINDAEIIEAINSN